MREKNYIYISVRQVDLFSGYTASDYIRHIDTSHYQMLKQIRMTVRWI